jgi:hypothetical protein
MCAVLSLRLPKTLLTLLSTTNTNYGNLLGVLGVSFDVVS